MKDKDCTGHFSQGFLFMRKENILEYGVEIENIDVLY